jgi:hypothetical protein
MLTDRSSDNCVKKPCMLEWVDFLLFYIFHKRTPVVCCIPSKSKENENIFCFDSVTAS